MRGEWQASEVHLVGPDVALGLDASGKLRAPSLPIKFNPDNLSIDRLNVEDGTVTLSDAANGARATLTGVWFNGEARSLLGPFKGEGAATIGGELYPFRLATGRVSPTDGALKLQRQCRSGQPAAEHRRRRHADACRRPTRNSTARSIWRGRSSSPRAATGDRRRRQASPGG